MRVKKPLFQLLGWEQDFASYKSDGKGNVAYRRQTNDSIYR